MNIKKINIKICNIFNKRNISRIVTGITMLALLMAGGANALSSNAPAAMGSEVETFLSLINDYRAQNNVGMLSIDSYIQEASEWMSNDMLANCVAGNYDCSHTDSTGRTFDKRLRDFGYPAGVTASAGENIAWGSGGSITTAQQAFDLWKNSPGHNSNMLDSSYTAIGISRSCNGGDCAWVTDFGSKVVQPIEKTTLTPTATPTPKPTIISTSIPTSTQVHTPIPTPIPTLKPTLKPTMTPTLKPTLKPTMIPTPKSTPKPTIIPTPIHTAIPTPTPIPSPISTPDPVPVSGSISGHAIEDINNNGKWDHGEKGISDRHIKLIGSENSGDHIRKKIYTDDMGFYRFDNLPAGRYTISERIKRGAVPTSSAVSTIVLAAGEDSRNNNFTIIFP